MQFLGHEEGRVRFIPAVGTTPASFVYDYFLKDHLGNIRMVLTEEQEQAVYPAVTLEGLPSNNTDPVYIEQGYYSINAGYVVNSSVATGISSYQNNYGSPPVNNNPNCSNTSTIKQTDLSQKLYQLNSTTNKTGLGITLKVMSGDKINIYGKSYFFQNNTGGNGANSSVPVSDIVAGLLGSPTGIGTDKASTGDLNSNSGITNLISTYLSNPNRDNPGAPTTPKAAINWILLDEQFKIVTGNFSKVTTANAVKDHHGDAALQDIPVTKNGYLYVYVSNESPVNVFFDNLQVIHDKGPILEETHYYPFGLVMAGINSKAMGKMENKYKFNGIESDNDLDINIDEAFYRNYDPQIGRFWQIDPKATNDESPYSGLGNNPIKNVDPLGDDWLDRIVGTLYSIVDNLVPGSNLRETYNPTDAKDYNQALQAGDYAMLTAGTLMVKQGETTMEGGLIAMAAGPEVGGPVIAEGAAQMALGIDISVNAAINIAHGYNYGTEPNNGEGPKHGSDDHNNAIDKKVEELKHDPDNSNIRKNQTQHDADGNKVGDNRPDLQWDNKNDGHHNHEWDHKKSSSEHHKKRIKKNDKKATNHFDILPRSTLKVSPNN